MPILPKQRSDPTKSDPVPIHHCHFETANMDRSVLERVQEDYRNDDYYTKQTVVEVCKFCGRARTTKTVVTVRYTPQRMVYLPGENEGLIPTFPTDHLVVRNIWDELIPGPNAPVQPPTEVAETTAGR